MNRPSDQLMFKNSRTGGKQIACPDVSITKVISTLENTLLLVMSLCMMLIMIAGPHVRAHHNGFLLVVCHQTTTKLKRLCWRTPHPPAPAGVLSLKLLRNPIHHVYFC